jgi:hypothetical protein
MASSTPLTNLTLGASSVADDLGYVALDDLARALADIAADYRVIGGHMVTTLVARCNSERTFTTARPATLILAFRRSSRGTKMSSADSKISTTSRSRATASPGNSLTSRQE